MKKYSFGKSEKLTNLQLIEELFTNGKSFYSGNLRLTYLISTKNNQHKAPISVLISVPKRYIKKSVFRNKIKRQLRECYRLNKKELYSCLPLQSFKIILSITYLSKTMPTYRALNKNLLELIKELINELKNK